MQRDGAMRAVFADPAVRVGVGVTLVIMLGYGLIVPVLPLYARSFGVGKTEVGLLLTSFALMRLLFDLVGGPMVDRLGPRTVATLGAVVVGVSAGLSALAPTFLFLLLVRAIGGAGSSLLFAAVMSHLVHSVVPKRMARTMSAFYASFLIGTALGQPIGGLIASRLGLASPLWFYAGACFLCAGLTYRFLRERGGAVGTGAMPPPSSAVPHRPTTQEVLAEAEAPVTTPWRRVRELLTRPGFLPALVANAALFWVLGAVRLTLVPLFAAEEIGLSEAGVGGVLGVAAVAQLLVMWKAGGLADERGRKMVLAPALAVLAVSTAAVGWADSRLTVVSALAVLGVATGFSGVAPAAIVADVAPKRAAGTAVGAYRFAGDLGFLLGPVTVGAVAEAAGFPVAFGLAALPVAIAFFLVLRMPETLKR